MTKYKIKRAEKLKCIAIAINKELDDLTKELDFRVKRIKKLAEESLNE